MLSANQVAKRTFVAAQTGQVMADQDPPSPTPIAVTLHYGLAVLPVVESHSGRLWNRRNFLPRLPANGEADE